MLKLMFWRWVVTFHDRLHDARDKMMEEEFVAGHDSLDEWFKQSNQHWLENWTYTSPAVHYQGVNRRKDD